MPPRPYIARFSRVRPVVMILGGVAVLVVSSAGVARGGRLGRLPPLAALVFAGVVVAVLGAVRLVRARRRGWTALAVDSAGVRFAATVPDGEPRRFAWDEVSALVLFSRRTEFLHGTVKCVGVRIHPAAAGSPERHLALLEQTLSQVDLELHVWERLRELDGGPARSRLETAVAFHTEVRGWRFRRSRLEEAAWAHGPGVPVVAFTSGSYHDLVGWRADQRRLREILDDARLRRWGW
ncbi:hypothetical protein [Actinomadura sp. DC4]|uniref:hypothetical protein n=1 Tax=Actinomadura sp. DC4 TaxID=3055069 RepID=UPI0025B053C0|nr:hypothetical protein [Actinomadura sp. DC4]MDN3356265.1 hypothetical protein [Actinomadura sp. DC4]